METYSLKEAAKKLNISPGRIKQWEKDKLFETPRTQNNARFFSETDLEKLLYLQQLSSSHISISEIQDLLQKWKPIAADPELKTSISVVTQIDPLPLEPEEPQQSHQETFFEAMDLYKQNFVNEMKHFIQIELFETMKGEMAQNHLTYVQALSEAMNKSTVDTKESIQELTDAIEKTNKNNANAFKLMEQRIASQTIETSEEFYHMAKELTEKTENLAHYLDLTAKEIYELTEEVEKEREDYVKDREQFRHDIRQREMAFQNMLAEYRETATSKANNRKWWKFW